ncbi:superoxide dismutase family protein [Paracoccus methylovorus]|uniref:Superoxide dismutase [Cu-Zn] n=1 Tax=Paracoccus methylovorus TaxID=2812658 RepID=A0ABX7JET9_9RHOB|nr:MULTISPECIES: superoxide dismutase family protein [Paracoccus]QRZ12136.1 superoxide dismutase family protein [Paracoccus methylovorus]
MHRYLLALGLAALPATAHAQDAKAVFIDANGQEAGTAVLTPTPSGVLIQIEATGLPQNQWVAFHIHETGSCDHNTGHESAGGHFNPSDAPHGILSDGGPHAGDMPNVWADAEGTARAQVFNPLVTLAEGTNAIKGRALMIHAGPDDYSTQPTGGAGDRLACAVIE